MKALKVMLRNMNFSPLEIFKAIFYMEKFHNMICILENKYDIRMES